MTNLDPLKHRISKKEMSILQLIAIFEPVTISIDDYEKASGLIESIILQAPIHHLIVELPSNGDYKLIDGFWRFGVISAFINEKFAITKSGYFPNFEGMLFTQLSPQVRRRITSYLFTIVILEPTMNREMIEYYVKQSNERKQ